MRVAIGILAVVAPTIPIYAGTPSELSLAMMKEYWVERLSATETKLDINFKPFTGDPEYFRLNNGPECWFADEKSPAPLKLTVHAGDRLALIGRHARLYFRPLSDSVSGFGFALQHELDGQNKTLTNHAFMVLVGTNGIARGIGEKGVVIVPPKVEAVQEVLVKAGLLPSPSGAQPSGEKNYDKRGLFSLILNAAIAAAAAAFLVVRRR